MNQSTYDAGGGLQIQIIDLYGQLLLDTNLIFAIILAWAVTHFFKQSSFINDIRPVEKRRQAIRLLAVFTGFAAVIFFKRDMLGTHPDHVINFAVMVAFTHPFLYKLATSVMDKFIPSVSSTLKSKGDDNESA